MLKRDFLSAAFCKTGTPTTKELHIYLLDFFVATLEAALIPRGASQSAQPRAQPRAQPQFLPQFLFRAAEHALLSQHASLILTLQNTHLPIPLLPLTVPTVLPVART